MHPPHPLPPSPPSCFTCVMSYWNVVDAAAAYELLVVVVVVIDPISTFMCMNIEHEFFKNGNENNERSRS